MKPLDIVGGGTVLCLVLAACAPSPEQDQALIAGLESATARATDLNRRVQSMPR
ncbi:MAG TPA: hypothetical protein PK954_24045 [Anaerolineales bacterium]|nr:hypothetical protein [Anaerolineales bacterium]HRF48830.1 hypothetical protein [Anaerolineales bacterium]